jgi:flagellar assembly protein FliH
VAQVIRSVHVEEAPLVLTYGAPAPAKEIPSPPAPAAPQKLPEPAPEPEVDLEALRKQAFEDGYHDGYRKGEAERVEALEKQAQEFERLMASAQRALASQVEGLEDVMVEIAFAAVCKLLGETALTEEGARGLVREAMRGVAAKEGLVVRVSPQDHSVLSARTGEGRADLVADDRVALGGCIIETTGGMLDARLEVQLQQLVETLTRARSAPAAE